MSEPLLIECTHCGQSLSLPQEFEESSVACPTCNGVLELEYGEEEVENAVEAPAPPIATTPSGAPVLKAPKKSNSLKSLGRANSILGATQPAPAQEGMMSLLFSFNGRARRSTYWAVTLLGGVVALMLIGGLAFLSELGGVDESGLPKTDTPYFWIGMIGMCITALTFMIITWAVTARRWHDRNKTGWMILVSFIPIIGGFWTLIECGFLDGSVGENAYGHDPKGR